MCYKALIKCLYTAYKHVYICVASVVSLKPLIIYDSLVLGWNYILWYQKNDKQKWMFLE